MVLLIVASARWEPSRDRRPWPSPATRVSGHAEKSPFLEALSCAAEDLARWPSRQRIPLSWRPLPAVAARPRPIASTAPALQIGTRQPCGGRHRRPRFLGSDVTTDRDRPSHKIVRKQLRNLLRNAPISVILLHCFPI